MESAYKCVMMTDEEIYLKLREKRDCVKGPILSFKITVAFLAETPGDFIQLNP